MLLKEILSININGRLMTFTIPKVMGILNITPDSFHTSSRCLNDDEIIRRIEIIHSEGADIIDIGGYSTRPGANQISESEEWRRVERALKLYKESGCDLPVSLDTFRSEIAKRGVMDYGVSIINDVSGGEEDPIMWTTVKELHVPYILTHIRGNINQMMSQAIYRDVTSEVIKELSWKVHRMRKLGICDIIIDPGFGFSKTPSQNLKLLNEFQEICNMGMPVLAGISRKSMISSTLQCSSEEALAGTICAQTIALMKGASILRVHDVKEAVDTVRIYTAVVKNNSDNSEIQIIGHD